ncbi:hypothetical protein DL93DRAFT_2074013 [Clavulina sp. PMI_390]|nr:hypothetical protein DL93DRAFT_2074013 [Clavulina sp. PMI_390]
MRPRLFSFQLLMFGKHARILRWDRSGALVTEAFEWFTGTILAEFLQRFSSMTHEQRGADPSASIPTDDEISTACDAFRRAGHDASPALKAPFHVYSVPGDSRKFLAGRPVTCSRSFAGRGCMGYVCYDLENETVHFMKDGWRFFDAKQGDDEVTEKLVYSLLNQKRSDTSPEGAEDDGEDYYFKDNQLPQPQRLCPENVCQMPNPLSGSYQVPHVPTLLCGGDIKGKHQTTLDHRLVSNAPRHSMIDGVTVVSPAESSEPVDEAARPHSAENADEVLEGNEDDEDEKANSSNSTYKQKMRIYVHFRLVLKEVGKPLSSFSSVQDLLQVLEDITDAHRYARKRGILHRDISAGNVMITEEGGRNRGLLVDWDLALMLDKANSHVGITVRNQRILHFARFSNLFPGHLAIYVNCTTSL